MKADITDFFSRFGFNSLPFTCELPVSKRFVSSNFNDTVEHLHRAVDKRMSAAVIAPAGTGKTACLRALIAKLPPVRYRCHYVNITDLSKRDMYREIATVTGVESAGNYATIVKRLQHHYSETLTIDGQRPVLILDEAHDMRPEVLSILKILTNFDMDSRLVVSIVLSGQPPLARLLRHPKLEDINRRLVHCATLHLLSREQTAQYVKHRCHIAGGAVDPFDNGALEAIFEIGRGNLRATDHLALKALELAHDQACDRVDSNHITQARAMLWP